MTDRKAIYPADIMRFDSLHTTYARIAVEQYAEADHLLKQLASPTNDFYSIHERFIQSVIMSIVFSAMCIESFLNDYASACMGDEEFYGAFDKLSVEGKLMLISKFLFCSSVDKSQKLYSCLRRLVKLRNEFVHNKATHRTFDDYCKHSNFHIMTIEEFDNGPHGENCFCDKCVYKRQRIFDQEFLSDARNGVLTIAELAHYFDDHDQNANAICHLFYPCIPKSIYESDTPYNNVLRELKI